MQLEIDPKTFLEALLESNTATARDLVWSVYRAAKQALEADRERYLALIPTIPLYSSSDFPKIKELEPTGRTSIEQQLANNPPSVPPEHAASTKPTPETWHQVRSIRQARMFVGQTVAVSYEPPSPHDDGDTHVHTYVADIVDQGRGCWSLLDTLGEVICSGAPCDDMLVTFLRPWGKGYGWTDADVYGVDSRERGPLRACRFDVSLDDYDEGMELPVQVGLTHGWAARERVYTDLETALEATRAADDSEEPADDADETSEWAKLLTIEDARKWLGKTVHVSFGPPDPSREYGAVTVEQVEPYDDGTQRWSMRYDDGVEFAHGGPDDVPCWVVHVREAPTQAEDKPERKPEWKGWARLYTINDAREWIGRKAHVSVGPPDLNNLGAELEIADVLPYSRYHEDGWKLMAPNGYLINFGAPTDEEPYVLHLLEVAESLWVGVDPSSEGKADVWVAPLRDKGSAIVDPSTWKPEPTEDKPKTPTLDKPKPGMWHKVTTREEAERFVGMRVDNMFARNPVGVAPCPPDHCAVVARVVSDEKRVWRMLDSKGEYFGLGCRDDESLDSYVWAFE